MGRRALIVAVLLGATPTARADGPSPYIYLNPCIGGCTVHGTDGGVSDPRTQSTPIAAPGTYTIGEFESTAPGDWADVTQCVREVFSPYDVRVTDNLYDIPQDAAYTELIVAGRPSDLGLPDVLSIAPTPQDCSTLDNAIGFAFANVHTMPDRTNAICASAAVAAGKILGLEYANSCGDVMSWRFDCGGRRFFRNKDAGCELGACHCGPTQNTHQRLLSLFGAGMSIVPPPTARIVYPKPGATIAKGEVVHVSAGSVRGVERVELSLNGHVTTSVPGRPFGANGQPDPADYVLRLPDELSDRTIDIVATAYDDLGAVTHSTTVTVTNGAPSPEPEPTTSGGGGCSATNAGGGAAFGFGGLVALAVFRRRRRRAR